MTGINHLPPNNNLPLLNKGAIPKGAPLQNHIQAQTQVKNHQVKNHQAQTHQAQNHIQTPQQQVRAQTQLAPRTPPQHQIPQQNIPPQLLHAIRTPISLTPSSQAIVGSVVLPEIAQIFSQISDLIAQNNSASLLKFQHNIPHLQTRNFAQKILQHLTQIGKGESYQFLLEGLNLNQVLDKQLKQLFGRLEQISRQILNDKDGDAWQRIFLPLLSDKQMQFITFYVPYHGQQQQKQKPKQKPKPKPDEKMQRFILSFDFSGTGMIEIDLYMEEEKRIYMVLRTIKKVDAMVQQMMRELIENVTASMGMDGFLAFQQSATLVEMPLDTNGNMLGGNILSGRIL
ncbi:MAG: hypothetical protein K0U39_05605 [Alphaproteobacteria bacterium]|nr:hypothetical protein [Alphaproteobacteria bacterium]